MNRIDWLILRRVAGRVALAITIFFAFALLVQTLNNSRFQALSAIGGPILGFLGFVAEATRWTIATLPVTVLIGAILGMLELQARQELTVIKATGISIWRIMRLPLIAVFVFGLGVALIGDTLSVQNARSFPDMGARGNDRGIWLEQNGADGRYVLEAQRVRDGGRRLEAVSLFFSEPPRERIEAGAAVLERGLWALEDAVRYRPDEKPTPEPGFRVATYTTYGDMQVRLTSANDLTVYELFTMASRQIADQGLRAQVLTGLLRLMALPFLLVGTVTMAFAFTVGYRRTNKYGATVLYGVVLGFVVYVLTEMASRAGFAGVLEPAFAAAGPAFVAIVIGSTVLLHREDGRV